MSLYDQKEPERFCGLILSDFLKELDNLKPADYRYKVVSKLQVVIDQLHKIGLELENLRSKILNKLAIEEVLAWKSA